MTFATASVILGALSPVALFVVWNTPPLGDATQLSSPEYGLMQLTLGVFIACAGVAGNQHVVPLLSQWTKNAAVARKVLLTWLAGNLFLGSQIVGCSRSFGIPRARHAFSGASIFAEVFETMFGGGAGGWSSFRITNANILHRCCVRVRPLVAATSVAWSGARNRFRPILPGTIVESAGSFLCTSFERRLVRA
jgi:hypothetical protein